ncbi:hypothetical protein G0Z86_13425 [Staphylococcus aureus]|uniref:hypothetical protein n=1 Tax=Staphylococcus aureus TaxID=1280 RepID=UPI00061BF2CF|nr:hypothetical protein [Staphylococcus aureus]NEE96687.1 hypothetical protein [Staphylococcus aureus]NGD26499.1 hypothetical protein [Staphylococcus aureus]CPD55048.1 Uncharacterised protein [Staphylococcus aureus]HDF3119928.1 hypothetical protein [Staphylococcus aureus]HDG4250392.1 hypothetical protein [Staphylococcus aureus]
MLTKDIKYPYIKLVFDVIGILASIGFLLLLVINFNADFKSNGNIKIGVEWVGNDFVLGVVLICIILFCAIASFLLKCIKKH